MLSKSLIDLLPAGGELKIILTRNEKGARMAIIPSKGEVDPETHDKEKLARQIALTSPIVVNFDPDGEDLDGILSKEIAGYTPAARTAADKLEHYNAEQKKRDEDAAAAAKERESKPAKATKAAAKALPKGKQKVKGKDVKKGGAESAAQEAADPKTATGNDDLFSNSVKDIGEGKAGNGGDTASEDSAEVAS